MKIKRYIVTAVYFDDEGHCDGKARVLAACKSKDEAKDFVIEDMREYVDEHANESMVMDEDIMQVRTDDCMNGCEWNIDDVEIEIDEDDVMEFCDKAYNAGYRDGVAETESGVR